MRNSKIFITIFSVSLFTMLLSSCATTPKITRTAVDEQIDLSGNWNDTDSRMVSQEMITDCLSRPWLNDFMSAKGNKPRIIVGQVMNKSHEHINTETFVKDMERELINSGRVYFVADKGQREEVREEKMDQAENASMETAKDMGQETGADFMLKGQINTILDEAGKTQVRYYQTELELINILTNEKVWIGQKQIKKEIKRRKSSF
ncbi:MAG: penicillin-binding protein activator LpoB [Elusimicrobiota bacterium]